MAIESSSMSSEVNSMSPEVTSMSPEITSMAPEVTSMTSEVPSMSSEVTSMSSEITSMSSEVSSMAPEVSRMALEASYKLSLVSSNENRPMARLYWATCMMATYKPSQPLASMTTNDTSSMAPKVSNVSSITNHSIQASMASSKSPMTSKTRASIYK